MSDADAFPDLVVQHSALGDTSLPRLLYEQLRGNILTGVLQGGQVLHQEELARRFNVSRIPLREALSQLEADGLIEARPRRGYAVPQLTAADVAEINDMRLVLEEQAGYIAAASRTEADVRVVGELVERMERLSLSRKEARDEWVLLNYEFHMRIVAATKRKRLIRAIGTLRATIEPYIRKEIADSGPTEETMKEHREILKAFKAGNSMLLAKLSKKHIKNASKRYLGTTIAEVVPKSGSG